MDPIADIIGDYRAFAAMQRDRLLARGIDVAPYPLSHLAVRVADWDLLNLDERRALIRVVVDRAVVRPGRGPDRITVEPRG